MQNDKSNSISIQINNCSTMWSSVYPVHKRQFVSFHCIWISSEVNSNNVVTFVRYLEHEKYENFIMTFNSRKWLSMYPENPEETQVFVGSMDMGYIVLWLCNYLTEWPRDQ